MEVTLMSVRHHQQAPIPQDVNLPFRVLLTGGYAHISKLLYCHDSPPSIKIRVAKVFIIPAISQYPKQTFCDRLWVVMTLAWERITFASSSPGHDLVLELLRHKIAAVSIRTLGKHVVKERPSARMSAEVLLVGVGR